MSQSLFVLDALLVLQAKYEVYIKIWEQNKGKKLNAEAAT